jgi:hypothetical protein
MGDDDETSGATGTDNASSSFDLDAPSLEERALTTQLAAVALLAARSDRDVAQHDILLATTFELLAEGPLNAVDIESAVRLSWPHLNLPEDSLRLALDAAVALDHIGLVNGKYELRELGRSHLVQTSSNAQRTVDEFVQSVHDEMIGRRQSLLPAEADSIANTVIAGVREIVGQAFRSSGATTEIDGDGNFRVVEAESGTLEAWLNGRLADPERQRLVKDLVLMCIDRSTPLGTDLVHDLVVGHILYAFMSRPDISKAMDIAGTMTGQTVILDTPVLVRLMQPGSAASSMRRLLARAIQIGIDLVVFERTIVELQVLLDSAGSSAGVRDLEDALREGSDPLLLASLQRAYELNWCWLHWAASQPVARRTWAEWRSGLEGEKGILTLLKAIGIIPREGTSFDGDLPAAAQCADLNLQLTQQLREAEKHRSDAVIRHDALNLTEVWRIRLAFAGIDGCIWPGAFLLSPDAQLNRAYDASVGLQTIPAVMGFTQLTAVVGRYLSARESEQFANEVAAGVTEQLLLSKAGSVDSATARRIAEALRSDAVYASDTYQLKLDYDRVVRSWRENENGPSADLDNSSLEAELVECFRSRSRALEDQRRDRADRASRMHSQAQAAAMASVRAEREHVRRLESQIESLVASAPSAEDIASQIEIARRRSLVAGVVIGASLIIFVIVALIGSPVAAAIVLISTAIVWSSADDYRDGKQSLKFWIATVVNLVAAAAQVILGR